MNAFQARTILRNKSSFYVSSAQYNIAFNLLNSIAFKTGQAFKQGTAACINTNIKPSAEALARITLINQAEKLLNQ